MTIPTPEEAAEALWFAIPCGTPERTWVERAAQAFRERDRAIRAEEWKRGWYECHEHYERQRDPWRVRQ